MRNKIKLFIYNYLFVNTMKKYYNPDDCNIFIVHQKNKL